MNDTTIDHVRGLVAETRFSGAIRIDVHDRTVFEQAYGALDRAHGIPNSPTTRFALASGTKTFTALAVLSLVEEGVLSLDTRVRSVLGTDLPLIDERVTVEHLLTHRSGIGDYLDENAQASMSDYVMPVPVHRLDSAEAYLAVLGGHPQVFAPGDRLSYNNSGYVILALVAERATQRTYADLVRERVVEPARLTDTTFERSDSLPGDVAIGYLDADGLRSNVLHLPLLGVGDGGLTSSLADIHRLWGALLAGRIVAPSLVAEMTRPHGLTESGRHGYGYGLWLSLEVGAMQMEGNDAGISFRSSHAAQTGVTYTVMSNTTEGAWPICEFLDSM